MSDRKQMEKMRDTFREVADIIDEILILDERKDRGEDVKKEAEAATGRFIMKMIELQTLQG